MSSSGMNCELGIERETLSAWRDEALPPAETVQLAQHYATCAACQATVAEFTFVEQTLTSQSVPPVPPRVWSQVQHVAAIRPPTRRRRVVAMSISAALIGVAAIIVLVAVTRVRMTAHSVPSVATELSSNPTVIPHPFDQGLMYNAALGNDLSYVFADQGHLSLSLHGNIKTIPLNATDVVDAHWGITWSPDQSRLLVTLQQAGSASEAWTVFVQDQTVTKLPAASPVIANCLGNADATTPCQWLLDRYILYPQRSAAMRSGTAYYEFYDLQTQQSTSSVLAQQVIQYVPVVRGPYVFFTPYGKNSVMLYDSDTNSITPFVTALPGPVLDATDTPAGGWALAPNTLSLFFVAAQPVPPSCGTA